MYERLVVDALRTITRAAAPFDVGTLPDARSGPSSPSEVPIAAMRAVADAIEEQIARVIRGVRRAGQSTAAFDRRRTIVAEDLARSIERHIVALRSRTRESGPSLPEQIRRFVETHFAEPLTLDDVAAAIGCARSNVAVTFKRHLGETMHRYLARIRVRRAVELIVQGDKIEAAMLAVGYRSKKNFYRQFKLETGDTPAGYRGARAAIVAQTPPIGPSARLDGDRAFVPGETRSGGQSFRNPWARPIAAAGPATAGEGREETSAVTIARASQLLGVTRRTVHYWIKKGKLRTTALPNGGRRILLGQ